ncbi:hypothetical protein HanIR_Chr07g0309851 [Helianthus annuus]|nr:hypothetical protein HanIR_Chr07g0309851 [Helianthus annuus]
MDIWVKGRIRALISGSNLTRGEGLRTPSSSRASGGHGLMAVKESTLEMAPSKVGLHVRFYRSKKKKLHDNWMGTQTYATYPFFERLAHSPNGQVAKIHHIRIHPPSNRENPHLGSKPMSTPPKARQCGEVKRA